MSEATKMVAVAFDVTDHGIDNSQYFQGHGTSFTNYDMSATGCGDNPKEAYEDALESLAQAGWKNLDIIEWEGSNKETPSVSDEVEEHHQEKKDSDFAEWEKDNPDADEDDYEEPEDDDDDGYMEDNYYYVSVRVRGYNPEIDPPEIEEKARLWGRLDDIEIPMHNAEVSGRKEEYKALQKEKRRLERRLERLKEFEPA